MEGGRHGRRHCGPDVGDRAGDGPHSGGLHRRGIRGDQGRESRPRLRRRNGGPVVGQPHRQRGRRHRIPGPGRDGRVAGGTGGVGGLRARGRAARRSAVGVGAGPPHRALAVPGGGDTVRGAGGPGPAGADDRRPGVPLGALRRRRRRPADRLLRAGARRMRGRRRPTAAAGRRGGGQHSGRHRGGRQRTDLSAGRGARRRGAVGARDGTGPGRGGVVRAGAPRGGNRRGRGQRHADGANG